MQKVLTVGILGGGQLGSMMCQAAKRINIKTVVISDDPNGPAKNFCDHFIYSAYDNLENIKKFIELIDVATYEFENIPYETLNIINSKKEVLPRPEINKIVQNRKEEKTFVNNLGIETTDWCFVKSKNDIKQNEKLLPGILKTNMLGYDGHGQFIINSLDDIKQDWCFTSDYTLEKLVKLKQEISVIITRFKNGELAIYEPIENIHKDQILKNSKIPANISTKIFEEAQTKAKLIAKKLKYVGTMCIEYFINKEEKLLVNEIAPRVHNSGHLTINAFNISQFENHIRAVCNLKVELIKKISNAEMKNILGYEIDEMRKKSFSDKEFFFDYGKKITKDKRKMGHITILKK